MRSIFRLASRSISDLIKSIQILVVPLLTLADPSVAPEASEESQLYKPDNNTILAISLHFRPACFPGTPMRSSQVHNPNPEQ
ncbi:hypothetical protein E4U52_007717 [Claviceps spartinae]|nr:hypothetical protein E4U52_007717 [Claviceps spartinae]